MKLTDNNIKQIKLELPRNPKGKKENASIRLMNRDKNVLKEILIETEEQLDSFPLLET